MGTFVPGTLKEQEALLKAAGYTDFDDLFSVIPESVYLKTYLPLEEGKSEMEASSMMEELAEENKRYRAIFRGAGAYDHYIPAIVKRVVSKETFLTAYTPYQAEISQGVLQSIFEYQSMICALTGMDVSNASVYDGATATAEAAELCVERKKTTVLISATVSPEVIKVVKTYAFGRDTRLEVIPEKDGVTDLEALKAMVGDETACVIMQQPNFYGLLEDADQIGEIAHSVKAKFVMNCNPISLGLLKTPAEYGADLAVGEGQSLGMPLSFGGPYLGFMASTQALMRKLPGRIVGQTEDDKGNT
ncbi:MAG: aminomethyl-transferring glycine dehydrogenase subunit GcvPA, partial [Firmicutes bacterium]|nr:aminomethyl-transferring glycine dehydrogenase subunit GcvPA [Bacillota bacterium]